MLAARGLYYIVEGPLWAAVIRTKWSKIASLYSPASVDPWSCLRDFKPWLPWNGECETRAMVQESTAGYKHFQRKRKVTHYKYLATTPCGVHENDPTTGFLPRYGRLLAQPLQAPECGYNPNLITTVIWNLNMNHTVYPLASYISQGDIRAWFLFGSLWTSSV